MDPAEMNRRIVELTGLVQKLQSRVDDLEGKLQASARISTPPPEPVLRSQAQPSNVTATEPQTANTPPNLFGLEGTTLNLLLDGYYQNNFNRPIGRDNLLRAYDVSSNSFGLNQAGLVLENAPDVAKDKRWGVRMDLQFGQATQSGQGNPANEPRPEIYRNIFQAYGTYVFPLGQGLTVDFGKWSSSIGLEGTYTKDQINYSRSFWFDFLPFYHMGMRAGYKVNDALTLNYSLTNGTQQTESFKEFKDELFGFNVAPNKNINWTVNYYFGQEHPDVIFYNNSAVNSPPSTTDLPTLQGVPFAPIRPAPKGHLHIFDSYMTWQASPKLTLALEGDYVIQRLFDHSGPAHTQGGAAYARYQLTPKFALAGRGEYMSDRGGLFSGATQALKETTFTMEYKIAEGFMMREEWRRDASNHPYFLTNTLGILKKEQNTATLGLIWWSGRKRGTW